MSARRGLSPVFSFQMRETAACRSAPASGWSASRRRPGPPSRVMIGGIRRLASPARRSGEPGTMDSIAFTPLKSPSRRLGNQPGEIEHHLHRRGAAAVAPSQALRDDLVACGPASRAGRASGGSKERMPPQKRVVAVVGVQRRGAQMAGLSAYNEIAELMVSAVAISPIMMQSGAWRSAFFSATCSAGVAPDLTLVDHRFLFGTGIDGILDGQGWAGHLHGCAARASLAAWCFAGSRWRHPSDQAALFEDHLVEHGRNGAGSPASGSPPGCSGTPPRSSCGGSRRGDCPRRAGRWRR